MTALDTRETRIRRALKRRGLTLVKSRRRDPSAIGFGAYHIAELYGARVMGILDGRMQLRLAPERSGGVLRYAAWLSLEAIERLLDGGAGQGDIEEEEGRGEVSPNAVLCGLQT